MHDKRVRAVNWISFLVHSFILNVPPDDAQDIRLLYRSSLTQAPYTMLIHIKYFVMDA